VRRDKEVGIGIELGVVRERKRLKFNPTKPKCFKPTYTNIESTSQLLRRISFTKKEFQRVSLCSTEMPSNGH
jgi:hypothetical protein